MTILPREETFGGTLGTALGTLAGHKIAALLKKHQQDQSAKEFREQWGKTHVPTHIVEWISNLKTPEERTQALQNYSNLSGLLKKPEQKNSLEALRRSEGLNQNGNFRNEGQGQGQMQGLGQLMGQHKQQQDPYQQLLAAARQFSGPMGQQQQDFSQQNGLGILAQQPPQQQQFSQPAPNQQVPGHGQPAQSPTDVSKLIQGLFETPQQKAARAKEEMARANHEIAKQGYEIKKQKHEAANEDKLRPFLKEQHAEFTLSRRVGNKAKEALKLLEKHKDELPYRVVGILPSQVQNLVISHPGIRKYAATINDIVKDLAGVEKGPLTKPRITLTEATKAGFSQPYETQKAILEDLVQRSKNSSQQEKFLASLTDENGYHAQGTQEKLVEFMQAQDYPLEYPQYYKPGTIIEEEDEEYENVGSKSWKLLNRK